MKDVITQMWHIGPGDTIPVSTKRGVILPNRSRTGQMHRIYQQAVRDIMREIEEEEEGKPPVPWNSEDPVITSGRDGEHSSASRHYIDCALDERLKHWDGDPGSISDKDREIAQRILNRFLFLGDNQYWGVVEKTHTHIEDRGFKIVKR